MTALVLSILGGLAIAAIVTTDERERAERLLYGHALSRRQAKRVHPSNYGIPATELDTAYLEVPEIAAAGIVPLICPVCGETFGHGYLNEHDGKVFGWIEKRQHECTKAGAA